MDGSRTCQACGVVAPGAIGRCPACGAGSSRRRLAWAVAPVGLAVVAVLAGWAILRPGRDRTPAYRIVVLPGITRYSADFRGTDATATIENPNPFSVDVALKAKGFDTTGKSSVEKVLKTIRNIPPGGTRDVSAYLDTIPLERVEFEAVEVKPHQPDL